MAWWVWLPLALLVVAVVLTAVALVASRRQRGRTARLRERFGPEYDRAVEASGGRRAGEAELEERLERHRRLRITAVPDGDRARYEAEWRAVEEQFDAAELAALAQADALVTTVLAERGYPMESFDRRAADLSVDYPEEVGHYRRARAAYRRADEGNGSREDMYEALQHYREFLDALVGTNAPAERSAQQERSGTGDARDGRPQRPPTPLEDPAEARRSVDDLGR